MSLPDLQLRRVSDYLRANLDAQGEDPWTRLARFQVILALEWAAGDTVDGCSIVGKALLQAPKRDQLPADLRTCVREGCWHTRDQHGRRGPYGEARCAHPGCACALFNGGDGKVLSVPVHADDLRHLRDQAQELVSKLDLILRETG